MQLTGIHHLTAVSADAPGNVRFYTQVLGMRLVKKTVNQDDVTAYHLFYADGEARPGTDLTFFDWSVPREVRGTHAIVRTALRVNGASLPWWKERLTEAAVRHRDIATIDGRSTLEFEDPEGQRLALIDDGGKGDTRPWAKSPVPAEQQIRGLGPITLSVPKLHSTDVVLREVMGLRKAREYPQPDTKDTIHVYEMGEGGPAAELHVAVQPGLAVAEQGAGAVHHVAFRTPDEAQYHAWTQRLRELGNARFVCLKAVPYGFRPLLIHCDGKQLLAVIESIEARIRIARDQMVARYFFACELFQNICSRMMLLRVLNNFRLWGFYRYTCAHSLCGIDAGLCLFYWL
jgi:glyoxalase family protein